MHLSIRPYAIPGQGDSMKKKKRRGRSGELCGLRVGILTDGYLDRFFYLDTTGSNEGDQETDGSGCCRCIVC